jgi:hypothetical protein
MQLAVLVKMSEDWNVILERPCVRSSILYRWSLLPERELLIAIREE